MKKVLSLLVSALWLAVAQPAVAGIAQIAGTAPHGALADLAFTGTGSLGQNITAAVGVGNLVAVLVQSFDTSPTLGCSDGVGNTWQAAPNGAFTTGAASQIWYTYTTNALSNGATITCTASVHTNGFTTQIVGFSGTSASPYDVSPSGATGSATSATVGASPTLSCPGGGTGCEVCLTGLVWHTSAVLTPDATWSNLGTTSGVSGAWANGYKIVNANTAQSYSASIASGSAFAGAMACFKVPTGLKACVIGAGITGC